MITMVTVIFLESKPRKMNGILKDIVTELFVLQKVNFNFLQEFSMTVMIGKLPDFLIYTLMYF